MSWFRVDNRLVHGQIIEAWLPYTGAKHLIVANDTLAKDGIRQQIISLAIPQRIGVHFISLQQLPETLFSCSKGTAFVLMADCQDAAHVFATGVCMDVLNVGNLHYGPGKKQVLPHVALSDADVTDLKYLVAHHVTLDFRCVPSETLRGMQDALL
ncbi:MAG: PTS sugar transporter subunit IIB [Desulfovibrionaceae bacterium]